MINYQYLTESQIEEMWGKGAAVEMREMGHAPITEPVYTLQQVFAWLAETPSRAIPGVPFRKLIVDFSTMTLRYGDQGPLPIDYTLKYRLLERMARRPDKYIEFDSLKRDVWKTEDVEDDTVGREIRRLRSAIGTIGLQGVTTDIRGHRAALKLL